MPVGNSSARTHVRTLKRTHARTNGRTTRKHNASGSIYWMGVGIKKERYAQQKRKRKRSGKSPWRQSRWRIRVHGRADLVVGH